MSGASATDLTAQIDACLPQTQCTRCGYPGCEPYAAAVAVGVAEINQCPPGGEATIAALARLLGKPPRPLNPVNGTYKPATVAFIDESRCIGCAKCLPPCPVDAIVGAAKYMHTVVAERCTGCELCVAPCPVDCIEMRAAPAAANDAPLNKARFAAHAARRISREQERQRMIAEKKAAARPA